MPVTDADRQAAQDIFANTGMVTRLLLEAESLFAAHREAAEREARRDERAKVFAAMREAVTNDSCAECIEYAIGQLEAKGVEQ